MVVHDFQDALCKFWRAEALRGLRRELFDLFADGTVCRIIRCEKAFREIEQLDVVCIDELRFESAVGYFT